MDDDATSTPAGSSPVERPVGRPAPERSVADIPDAELLRRVVRTLTRPRRGRKEFAWAEIHERFGLGSTYAAQLCRRFGIDPDSGGDLKTPNVGIEPPRSGRLE